MEGQGPGTRYATNYVSRVAARPLTVGPPAKAMQPQAMAGGHVVFIGATRHTVSMEAKMCTDE